MNDHLYKQNPNYYTHYGIRKFGWWIEDVKRKAHQELEELSGSGSAEKLVKAFNKEDIPLKLLIIFTPGGIDFVGGYYFYQFIKHGLA